jgi:hypothetical protein
VKRAALLVCAVVVVAVGVAWTANADEQTFLDAVAPMGYVDVVNTLSAGYAVCAVQGHAGMSLTERIMRRVLERLRQPVDAANSSPFAELAVANLCPRLIG